MGIDAAAPAQPEPRSAPEGAATGAVPVAASAEAATKQPQSVAANSTKSTASENADYGFVTFDSGRKHLARIIGANGKKVTVRRFNKKTGEWKSKNENIELNFSIPLTAAEAEETFPGCVAAWEATKLPGATTIKEDNPNATALVAAFKKNDHDMEAWRMEAAPMVEALENDLKESGEIWYDSKRYTSIKKWCEPALGIKYRAMRYRLTGGNPVSKRTKKGATVAPEAVTVKAGLVVKLAFSEQLYVVTEEPVINEDDDTRSFTLIVEPYDESRTLESCAFVEEAQ
jgi:hypothetical protein